MVVAICLSALFLTTINATAWQQRSCVIISNVAGSRKSRHFAIPSALRAAGAAAIRYPRKEVAAFALVTTVGPQPRPARSTPGEPGRAADRQAFASLSYLTHRQVLRNPHIAKEGRHDPDIHSLRHCHPMFRPRAPRAEPGGLPSSRLTALDFHRYILSGTMRVPGFCEPAR